MRDHFYILNHIYILTGGVRRVAYEPAPVWKQMERDSASSIIMYSERIVIYLVFG